MTGALLLAGFIAVIVCFGMSAVRWIGLKDGLSIIGAGTAVGLATCVVLTNAVGYVLPIRTAMIGVPAAMLVVAIALVLRLPKHALQWTSRRTLLLAGGATVLAGLAFARDWSSDYGSMLHLPLPVLILEGNFPIRDVTNPWLPLAYHYGSSLFAAQTMMLTGFSLTAAYAVQPILAAVAIVFSAVGLTRRLGGSDRAAMLAGLLALLGGGLFWLQGAWLAIDVIGHFFGWPPSEGSLFWWLTPTIRNIYAGPLVTMLGHRPIAMGSAFLFGFLVLVPELIERKGKQRWLATACAFLCGAGLALTLETGLALLFAAIGAWIVLLLFRPAKRPAAGILIVLCVAVLLAALHQGGILSVRSGDVGTQSFVFGFDGTIHYDGGPAKRTIALWSALFWRDYAPHFLLLAVSGLFLLRRRAFCSVGGLVWILAAAHLLAPVFIRFLPRENEMNRLIFSGFSLAAIPIALLLDSWKRRRLATALVGLLCLAGMLHVLTRLFFPTLRIEAAPLLPPMPEASAIEAEGYVWVRGHTTLDDGFYVNDDASPEGNWERIRFMTYAKRFAISGNYAQTMPEAAEKLKTVRDRCDIAVMKELGIRYVFIATLERADWFARTCDGAQWEIKYGAEGRELPRIFGLK